MITHLVLGSSYVLLWGWPDCPWSQICLWRWWYPCFSGQHLWPPTSSEERIEDAIMQWNTEENAILFIIGYVHYVFTCTIKYIMYIISYIWKTLPCLKKQLLLLCYMIIHYGSFLFMFVCVIKITPSLNVRECAPTYTTIDQPYNQPIGSDWQTDETGEEDSISEWRVWMVFILVCLSASSRNRNS